MTELVENAAIVTSVFMARPQRTQETDVLVVVAMAMVSIVRTDVHRCIPCCPWDCPVRAVCYAVQQAQALRRQ